MAIPLKGEAEFEHEGKPIKLVANVMVLINAEQETGFGVFELIARATTNLSVMASILRYAKAEADGELIELKAAAEIVMANDDAPAAVLTALSGALPAAKEGGENPPKAVRKRSGTGTKP